MVKEIINKIDKEQIASKILFDLTDWFGVPENTKNYIETSKELPFFACYMDDQAVGFIVLKETSPYTCEIYCMGVLKENHRQGIGKKLFNQFEAYAREFKYKFIQVKTVEQGHYDDYDLTNAFYKSVGFYELEVLPDFWDKQNPCQIYVKSIE